MTPTWKAIKESSRINPLLIPCDVPSFLAYYARWRDCLPSLATAAFVKEPSALEALEAEALRSGLNLCEAGQFRECLLKVIRRIASGDEEQRFIELRQLTRNGTGRVSGLGPTLTSIGIIRPSLDAGDADGDVSLGITCRGYNVRDEDGGFHQFWKDFNLLTWATHIDVREFRYILRQGADSVAVDR